MTVRRFFIIVFALSFIASAWAKPDFVMTPEEQEVVYPKATFDETLTKQMLEPGTAVIQGQAFNRQKSGVLSKKNGKQVPAVGTTIYLFPYTEYCAEVVALLKKYQPVEQEHSMETLQAEAQLRALTGEGLPEILPAKRVELDGKFPKIWRKTATTDKEGNFVFEDLKPGQYFLQSQHFMVSRYYRYDEQVGENVTESYWSNGEVTRDSEPIYESRSSEVFRKIQLTKVVSVPNDGATVVVELNKE